MANWRNEEVIIKDGSFFREFFPLCGEECLIPGVVVIPHVPGHVAGNELAGAEFTLDLGLGSRVVFGGVFEHHLLGAVAEGTLVPVVSALKLQAVVVAPLHVVLRAGLKKRGLLLKKVAYFRGHNGKSLPRDRACTARTRRRRP